MGFWGKEKKTKTKKHQRTNEPNKKIQPTQTSNEYVNVEVQKNSYDSIQAPRPTLDSILLPIAAVTAPLRSVTSCGHRGEWSPRLSHGLLFCFFSGTPQLLLFPVLTLCVGKACKNTLVKDWKYSIPLKTSMQAMETGG